MSGTAAFYTPGFFRMLDNLTARLAKIAKTLRGEARLTESNIQEALREVRIALLEADVALPVVKHFIDTVRAKALGAEVVGSLTPGQALAGVGGGSASAPSALARVAALERATPGSAARAAGGCMAGWRGARWVPATV